MTSLIGRILDRYGRSAVVYMESGETAEVKAFIRPETNLSQESARRTWSGLGEIRPGEILYIGSADVAISEGVKIVSGDDTYYVRKAVPVRMGETVLYQWGILTRGGA